MMRENIARLYQAMGLQKWLAKTNTAEVISKAKHDRVEPNADLVVPNLGLHFPIDLDVKYISWLKEHPSAIRSFDRVMKAAKGKQIVVFLDYDGTLSPIVNDPERAFMSDPMRSALRKVAKLYPTAIITGRSRDKVRAFVKLDEVYYAGSHGMDIMGPHSQMKAYDCKYQTKTLDKMGNEFTIFQPAQEFLPAIKKMLLELKETTSKITGVFIEDNRFCISVHYRHVQDEDYGLLEAKVESILSLYPHFHLTRGKKVLEIRPSIEWNKGNAVEYLLDTLGFADNANVLPFYIGDDKTDEDAFKVLKSRVQGCPIIVSSVPRDTMASYALRDPSEVLSFLLRLARWRETPSQ